MGLLEDSGDEHFDEVGNENLEISSHDDGIFITEIPVSDKGSSKSGGLKRKRTNKGKKLDWVDSAMHNWAESYVAKDENYRTIYQIMLGSGVEFHAPHPPASDPEACLELMENLKLTAKLDMETCINACMHLKNVITRRMFAAMDDECRLAWIKYLPYILTRSRNQPLMPFPHM